MILLVTGKSYLAADTEGYRKVPLVGGSAGDLVIMEMKMETTVVFRV